MALRTELLMRMVMPAIVPHSEAWPYLAMARFETGPSGNPHYHGFCVGGGNPRLQRVRADVGDGGSGDEALDSDLEEEDASEGMPDADELGLLGGG